ncbi:MAG: EamA family transporter [Chloroflexaceae bacterium]|nr:EamA family transporter [Chloroflexaceae bacterium]
MLLWLPLALLNALCESLKDVAIKRYVGVLSGPLITWGMALCTLPFLVPLIVWQGRGITDVSFWVALLFSVLINSVAVLMYVWAIQHSDLSTTVPMIAFTPLFLLFTSPILIGEWPTRAGVAGVVLVVAGSYLLNIRERRNGYLAPYRALLRDPGPRMMMGVAFLWSIAANLDKIGVNTSTPLVWVFAVNAGLCITLAPLALRRVGQFYTTGGATWGLAGALLLMGLLNAISLAAQMTALTLTLVAYVISVKRTSTVMSVLWGGLLFKEQHLRERLLGALVMLAGVVIISLSSL